MTKYKVTEPIKTETLCDGESAFGEDARYSIIIPAGTIINLEPVEEVKVKAFVPEKRKNYFFVDYYIGECEWLGDSEDKERLNNGNCFRTKEDAQIAKAKVIELFNSFK